MKNYLKYLWSKAFVYLHGSAVRDSKIDRLASISPGCNVIKCQMGRHSYIGNDTWVINTDIGSFCSIADNVYIGGAMHPMDWCSTSPVFQNIKHSSSKTHYASHDWNPHSKKVTIGNDVWIGHGAVINQGDSIGTGAIIGSNAVVTKDVPPYAVVAGVPAKILKYRFDDDTIKLLLKSKWWNMDDFHLIEIGKVINNKEKFMECIKKYCSQTILGGVILSQYRQHPLLSNSCSKIERRMAA